MHSWHVLPVLTQVCWMFLGIYPCRAKHLSRFEAQSTQSHRLMLHTFSVSCLTIIMNVLHSVPPPWVSGMCRTWDSKSSNRHVTYDYRLAFLPTACLSLVIYIDIFPAQWTLNIYYFLFYTIVYITWHRILQKIGTLNKKGLTRWSSLIWWPCEHNTTH